MRDVIAIMRALGDDNRVRTLLALREQELCVCQITELLRLAPSTVSKHLSILKQAGLVEARKNGRWIHYRLPEMDAKGIVTDALRLLERSLNGERQLKEDRRRLRAILKIDPEVLCKRL